MSKTIYPQILLGLLLCVFVQLNAEAQTKKPVAAKTAVKPVAAKTAAKTAITAPIKKPTPKPGATRISIFTDSGTIVVKLSDSTPLHRDNFIKLVKEGFYDSLLFHRVIPEFMIQGGDPASKNAAAGTMLGNGGADMARIPAEFKPSLFHKKGALAAARDGNPEKASSAAQFYIVDGKKYTDEQLTMVDQQKGVKYTEAQRMYYKTVGGTPQLDGAYTVFGEVESGLEVIGKIARVPKDGMNRPLGDVRMKMTILK